MTNFIPVFPIDTVIFPDELYRMHIANDQQKQLITDCYGENKAFGIVPVINQRLAENGTLVEIAEVVEVWEDGRMNILVKGTQLFKTLETIRNIPDKLYSGAIVSYQNNVTETNTLLAKKVLQLLKEFHHLINFTTNFSKEESELNSYDMAHIAGLSLPEEQELSGLLFESQRLEYLRRHLIKTIPVLVNIQSMLKRSAQSHDFKNHKGFDFDANII